jgi:NTP pyrophosphatase (non-canonical NTP hydrolase)
MSDIVYVVAYLGVPRYVCWSKRTARERVEGKTGGLAVWTITEAPLEDIQTFMRSAMAIAQEKSDTVGDKPVVIPNQHEAFLWLVSEVGEIASAVVKATQDWKRNHPEKHIDDDDYGTEVGQAIMMAILASTKSPFGVLTEQLAKWGWFDLEVDYVTPGAVQTVADILFRPVSEK